jgi:gluconate kinase
MKAWFLFGLMGCGKSHAGRLLAQHHGFFFKDGDDLLTPSMNLAIAEKRQFTDAMRDEYFAVIADYVLAEAPKHERIVVAQAAYKERHRRYLQSRISGLKLVWIDTPHSVCVGRLQTPEKRAYADLILPNFEPPPRGTATVKGDCSSDELVERLGKLLKEGEV